MSYGIRAGASLDDDLTQLLVGGQVDAGRLAENVRLQPFLTLGFGDDALSFMLAQTSSLGLYARIDHRTT